MSERRPTPAVELARFAGLLDSEEERAPAAPVAPAPVNVPVRRPRARPTIISTVLDEASIARAAPAPPPIPTISIGKVVLDGATIAQQVKEASALDMLRAAFGRELVGVRTQGGPRKTTILAVLRQRVRVPRPKPIYLMAPEGPVWGDLRETDVDDVEVEVDVTEAVLTSNYEALRRLAAEHVR